MGLRTGEKGTLATVWDIRAGKGNYTDVQFSTSKKDVNGNYYTDFNGWARFIGRAKDLSETLKKNDKIWIKEFEITNTYSKEKNQTYYNIAVFVAELADFNNNSNNTSSNNTSNEFLNIPDDASDEGLPFN
jgi:hypothetical protein